MTFSQYIFRITRDKHNYSNLLKSDFGYKLLCFYLTMLPEAQRDTWKKLLMRAVSMTFCNLSLFYQMIINMS